MSKEDYKRQVLNGVVTPFFILHESEGLIFMENGNKAHGLKDEEIKRWKTEHDITCLEHWPLPSPDFNPIENIWRLLKQRLKNRMFTKVEDLKRALQEEWDKLTQWEIQKQLITLPWRMEEAVERNGLATRF